MTLSSLPPLRDILKRDGLWAEKRLGQHFLLEEHLLDRIARVAGSVEGRVILEIGPGPGGLTRALLKAGAEAVFAIEADTRFAPALEELAAASGGRLRPVWGDAMRLKHREVVQAGDRPIMVVANLPYNVATPLLTGWLSDDSWIEGMALMFQKEVADRVTATVGTDAYGRLAVLTALRREADNAMALPPGAFVPPPKVHSAVVRIGAASKVRVEDVRALEIITAAAFGQRRKMLRSSLKACFGAQIGPTLMELGIDETLRAEQVPPADFKRIAEYWRAGKFS